MLTAGLTKLYQALVALGNSLQPFFLLFIRLFWGWQFFIAGFGKFADIEKISGYFETLAIPYPLLSAYLAASAEMFGGALLLIGLGSRLAAIPLIITMLTALSTAHIEKASKIWEDPTSFLALGPVTFLLAALIIFVFGPGMFSVDGLIKRILNKN